MCPLCPPAEDLYLAPELAVLAALDATVECALRALVAAHPYDHDRNDKHAPPERLAARALADAGFHLVAAINRYRLAVALARRSHHDDRLPF